MAVFQPTAVFKHITDIPLSFFVERDIKAIILDVDNTLTSHNNPIPADGVSQWLQQLKCCGFHVAILSNNSRKRVAPFAQQLGLDYITRACKPLTFGVTRACKKYGLASRQVALIGDQIFTDILGGNLKGICTVLVEPYKLENGWFFRLKRKLEKPVLRKYHRLSGKH